MRTIAFDIETMRSESMIGKMPAPEVALGNLKDPEKIAVKTAEALAEQISRMALSPLTGIICSAAISCDDGERTCMQGDESDIIKWALNTVLSVGNQDVLVTWNGIGFDLPFLFKRAILRDIRPARYVKLSIYLKRYVTFPHCDLMQVWGGWGNEKYTKLNDVARAVLGEVKDDVDVSKLHGLMATEEGRATVAKYNQKDADLTLRLFQRFEGILI